MGEEQHDERKADSLPVVVGKVLAFWCALPLLVFALFYPGLLLAVWLAALVERVKPRFPQSRRADGNAH